MEIFPTCLNDLKGVHKILQEICHKLGHIFPIIKGEFNWSKAAVASWH